MAGYQRFVYYIYSYDNGEKRTNVGFLRIEVRNGICKMTIQIRALSQTQPLKIYLFKRARQQLNCYEIGSLPVRSGMGNITLNYTMDELARASLSLTELGGMILFSSREKFYATTWDDGDILVDEMVIMNTDSEKTPMEDNAPAAENKRQAEQEQTAADETTMQGGQTETARTTETGRQVTDIETSDADRKMANDKTTETNSHVTTSETSSAHRQMTAETNQQMTTGKTTETNRQGTAGETADTTDTGRQEQTAPVEETLIPPHPDRAADAAIQNEAFGGVMPQSQGSGLPAQDVEVQCFFEDASLEYASRILSTYPKMYPFEGDDVVDCVRIELQDIHELPIEHWPLAHNSFLMQGYYSYLHLVFALIKKKNGEKSYVIGIPGICHAKQHYLAGLFGFQQFMPLRMTRDINGEFGYWIYELSKTNA